MTEPKKPPQPPQAKRIDLNLRRFQAAGNWYFIQDTLTVARYAPYNKLAIELAYGLEFEQVHAGLQKIYNAVSSGNDVLGAIRIAQEQSLNMINAIVDFHRRDHGSVLRFCALFVNREGEDLAKWDDRVVQEKIDDWTAEGIEIADFFLLAANFIPRFRDAFREQNQKPEGGALEKNGGDSRSSDGS